MPKRSDISSILVIGAGPIIIGQACEFDYSGMQACKALTDEGFRVILVNSNPATIMTDPETADAVYIEPITPATVERIIEVERPDALLPTMGGQTALNCALDLYNGEVLKHHGVEMIGASQEAIDTAEDREAFREAMNEIGLATPASAIVHNAAEGDEVVARIGFPIISRPSFTLGGSGGGIAYNREEFDDLLARGLELSPTHEVLLEQSVLGWKEYEMEVVRDHADNCIIVCAIENIDPMGVHTGDSITVAPTQTLTDKEYQRMRDGSLACLRRIGVDTGGSNVQFAINPVDGQMIVIEMNPRVSRSSALASKATGFPVAKVAAKLAVGYTLDELANEITGGATPASFEPSIDYVVTKMPRFTFEKFPAADNRLTTQMKSVGEAMAIGRSFPESLQKAMRSVEIGSDGFEPIMPEADDETVLAHLRTELANPNQYRLWQIGEALRRDMSLAEIFELTQIDPWFTEQIAEIIAMEGALGAATLASLDDETLADYKRIGFSDRRLARLLESDEFTLRRTRQKANVTPVYKRVDSCAAEFPTATAYQYSTYEQVCEASPGTGRKIMVLGGGPNRIGQGIEFDYCCVHAALAMREDGCETVMVNCNPETVSTDYDTSDRLYFEPLTFEDVMAVVDVEKPDGIIVQYGGQTPLGLARRLEAAGAPIIGTSPDSIDLAEDRDRFLNLIHKLGLKQPANRSARSESEAIGAAAEVGYPMVVRPSHVLGGRAMEVVYNRDELQHYMDNNVRVASDSPVLLDRFLEEAIELDVDAVSDGEAVYVGGIMEHIEQAGVHSGDSACCLPPYSLDEALLAEIREQTATLARALSVVGLMNVQFAIVGRDVYILEVNPRASRTVPFVSKATGVPLARIAARAMAGQSLADQGVTQAVELGHYAIKEAVFPFKKFPAVDPLLGPEMKSTGEVMGAGRTFGEAFAKSQLAAGMGLPDHGTALITVRDADKSAAIELGRTLTAAGLELVATRGTADALNEAGVACRVVNKVKQGRPHIVDMIKNGEIALVINTTEGKKAIEESRSIRIAALRYQVAYFTTIAGARACSEALSESATGAVYRLQALQQAAE
ncbi:carbamoyl-phosphate synthase large subunit [Salinisphaera sp. USBA-960]|uniref:carbamoyl-phosphate synthase large subunit n=1 Tax=Salinisphaera orenii TaxID=856731 RepID=UPI000DBE53AA|nr:carbamoyl-phosphate synthase large subunit [Salifodinibacter halophilus]NNC25520.1 carbamoyl-phosphate synthase large subunit [Salifodinibacter halophilus]